MNIIIGPDGQWLPLEGSRVILLPELDPHDYDHSNADFIVQERRSRHVPVVTFHESDKGPYFVKTANRGANPIRRPLL